MTQNKKIESITIKELFDQSSDGQIPVLLDIRHSDIYWGDKNTDGIIGDTVQENGHLRLINNNVGVNYSGHYYAPAYFSFIPPSEDGKTVGSTSITISAIDQRIIQVIRSIKDKPRCYLEAFYTRISSDELAFSKLYQYEFEMDSVTWDGISAKWNLVFDPAMQLNVPRDLATANRCPGISQNQ